MEKRYDCGDAVEKAMEAPGHVNQNQDKRYEYGAQGRLAQLFADIGPHLLLAPQKLQFILDIAAKFAFDQVLDLI